MRFSKAVSTIALGLVSTGWGPGIYARRLGDVVGPFAGTFEKEDARFWGRYLQGSSAAPPVDGPDALAPEVSDELVKPNEGTEEDVSNDADEDEDISNDDGRGRARRLGDMLRPNEDEQFWGRYLQSSNTAPIDGSDKLDVPDDTQPEASDELEKPNEETEEDVSNDADEDEDISNDEDRHEKDP